MPAVNYLHFSIPPLTAFLKLPDNWPLKTSQVWENRLTLFRTITRRLIKISHILHHLVHQPPPTIVPFSHSTRHSLVQTLSRIIHNIYIYIYKKKSKRYNNTLTDSSLKIDSRQMARIFPNVIIKKIIKIPNCVVSFHSMPPSYSHDVDRIIILTSSSKHRDA